MTSRFVSPELAISRALASGHDIAGAMAASDSFFPFPDGPAALIEAGVMGIVSTSGSVRDDESIKCCQSSGVALWLIPDAKGRGFFGH